MADEQKNKLQKTILIIAVEIDRICKENGIQYDMDGGTLLGSIRHKGFIPWDDDFDIGMKRNEYERFLRVCDKQLDKELFTLQTINVKDYAFAFAKIHLNGTRIIEDFSNNVNVHHGIFVDVFPFDNLPDNLFIRRLFLFRNHLLKNLIWIKCGYGVESQKRKLSYRLLKFLGKPISVTRLKNAREKLLNKYNDRQTDECFTSDYPMYHLKNKWFQSIIDLPFEDKTFPGFKDFDAYLTTVFGNYMELPPENKRRVHTNQKVDFGHY